MKGGLLSKISPLASSRDAIVTIACFIAVILMLSFNFVPQKTQCNDNLLPSLYEQVNDSMSPRRCAFIDLGANRADTLKVWLKEENAKFQYDFPLPFWVKQHSDCEIYLFEANPLFTPELREAEKVYNDRGIKVKAFPETAVSAFDGQITLYLDEVNVDHDFWGTTVHGNGNEKVVNVTAMDVGVWLKKTFGPQDYVLVKMDIEKAEYDVLPRFLEVGAGSVIDVLLVEYHPYDTSNGQHQIAADAAIKLSDTIFMPKYDSPA
ncbi:hypothetical protein SmJEL517_g04108 [Synchytrium microbalum]|uniref:Methyltransferase FkbM domain-containing protein n=1 Tax=Synchytrium microbalum TaxID=1806994 RepID=A0A507C0B9_9FUNG|nr:uncharacterized protein SmJEL517_g04108 [Synchytrium microbalum]TPX32851.1 hypothetical protein SmJEL517_g04108 [Synchytrium microbalum]